MSNTRNLKWGALVLIFAVVCNFQSLAWGKTGHRAIAEIGWHQLDKQTKRKIKALLGDDYLPLYANYADEVRSERENPLSRLPHYVNMPFEKTYEAAEKSEKGDLVTVMADMVNTVKSKTASKDEKAAALMFIIHLVGDAHQPMHVGLAEDLGGNKVDVKWFGHETNLHHIWDSELIDFSQLSYTELARFAGTPDASELKSFSNTSVVDWIDETHEYTKIIYDNLGDKNYGYEYYHMFNPMVMKQIQKAGYRLGATLNELMKGISVKDLK